MSEKERFENIGEQDGSRLLSLLRPAVKQLADLHRSGKVHGEIRPESVVIRNHIRFCFPLPENAAKAYTAEQKGFASLKGPEEETGEGRTLFCIPPERLFAAVPANLRADVYSMCAVLYQKLTGTEPPDARSRLAGAELKQFSALGIGITEQQEVALMKGLSMMAQDRYEDGEQLYHGLYEEEAAKHPALKTGEKRTAERVEKIYDSEKENAGSVEKKSETDTSEKKPCGVLREGWHIKDDIDEIEKLSSVTFLDFISPEADGKWDVSENRDGSVMTWLEKTGSGKEENWALYIGADGGVRAAADSSWLFAGCTALEAISFKGNFDTSLTVSMKRMFSGCEKLAILDVSDFDTCRVEDMSSMFSDCENLLALDLKNFDTCRTVRMDSMFACCKNLCYLNISGFETSSVVSMAGMFAYCERLPGLSLKYFDTSAVTEMQRMFLGCASLTTLDLSNFDTRCVKNMKNMFEECVSLTSLNVSGFDTARVTDMRRMFADCGSLASLDVSSFDTAQVTDMGWMFKGCGSLTSLDVSGFNTARVMDMSWMFYKCGSLTSLDVSGFDTAQVTDMSYMFSGCTGLEKLNLRNFDMSNVEKKESMILEELHQEGKGMWKRKQGLLHRLFR